MNDSQLDQLLKEAWPAVPPPPGFQRDVWSRIGTLETTQWIPRMGRILDRFFGFFTLPPVAVTTCTAMVVYGAWCGMQPGPAVPSGDVAYIQSVSPFARNR